MKTNCPEVAETLDTLIGIVSDRLATMRDQAQGEEDRAEYYRIRLGLAFLLGLRDRPGLFPFSE